MCPADTKQNWRPMLASDLDMVGRIAAVVHPDYPEEDDVLAEKLALHPAGCLILEQGGRSAGYLFSHPWRRGTPPKLNTRLGALPERADIYYLHDIAMLTSARGTGAGRAALAYVVRHAASLGLTEIALVAVGGAESYWSGQGFAVEGESPYGSASSLMVRRIS